ncbi:hypothetical protein EYR40_010953 [Pleurotus pulmonarius]|nr:hypothetical protein EYR36_002721 [Pleurotus pulmonarius]KAF4586936.1 hypothetical protein EYR40_010953 [Pleurotus pulmonarius]
MLDGGGADDTNDGANTTSTSGGDAGQFLYFSYFTSLSFIGITIWTVIQAVRLTKMVWLGGDISDEGRVDQRADEEETRSEKEVDEEKRRVSVEEIGGTRDSNPTEGSGGERRGWKVLSLAYEVLYSTISTFPYSSTSQHILNAVVSLAETFILTSSPSTTNAAGDKQRKTNLPYIYLPITVVLLGLYLCVAYITNASQGVYVYPFLDPSKGPILAAYIVGIGLAQCVVFVLVRWGVMLRDWSILESGSAWGSFIGLKEKGGDVRLLGCATIVVGIL